MSREVSLPFATGARETGTIEVGGEEGILGSEQMRRGTKTKLTGAVVCTRKEKKWRKSHRNAKRVKLSGTAKSWRDRRQAKTRKRDG